MLSLIISTVQRSQKFFILFTHLISSESSSIYIVSSWYMVINLFSCLEVQDLSVCKMMFLVSWSLRNVITEY